MGLADLGADAGVVGRVFRGPIVGAQGLSQAGLGPAAPCAVVCDGHGLGMDCNEVHHSAKIKQPSFRIRSQRLHLPRPLPSVQIFRV